jgi:hypothetical protein
VQRTKERALCELTEREGWGQVHDARCLWGHLEADLVVVDRNPLKDITNVQDVLVVVSNGRLALNRLPFARAD